MNYYLIDYENVHGEGMNVLYPGTPDDHIYLFYTQNASTISLDLFNELQAKLTVIKVAGGSQSLDMHLISYLGYLLQQNGKDDTYVILSNDQGYDRVISFWINHGYPNMSRMSIDTRKGKTRTRKKAKTVNKPEVVTAKPDPVAEIMPQTEESKEESKPVAEREQPKTANIEVRVFSKKTNIEKIEPEVIEESPSDTIEVAPSITEEIEEEVSEVIPLATEDNTPTTETVAEETPAVKKPNRKRHRKRSKHHTTEETVNEVPAETLEAPIANEVSVPEEVLEQATPVEDSPASDKSAPKKKKKKKKPQTPVEEKPAESSDATAQPAEKKEESPAAEEVKAPVSKKAKKDGSHRVTVNNAILKALSAESVENSIASNIASTAMKLYDDDNNKQMIYRALVKSYGRKDGLVYYNLIKGLL